MARVESDSFGSGSPCYRAMVVERAKKQNVLAQAAGQVTLPSMAMVVPLSGRQGLLSSCTDVCAKDKWILRG